MLGKSLAVIAATAANAQIGNSYMNNLDRINAIQLRKGELHCQERNPRDNQMRYLGTRNTARNSIGQMVRCESWATVNENRYPKEMNYEWWEQIPRKDRASNYCRNVGFNLNSGSYGASSSVPSNNVNDYDYDSSRGDRPRRQTNMDPLYKGIDWMTADVPSCWIKETYGSTGYKLVECWQEKLDPRTNRVVQSAADNYRNQMSQVSAEQNRKQCDAVKRIPSSTQNLECTVRGDTKGASYKGFLISKALHCEFGQCKNYDCMDWQTAISLRRDARMSDSWMDQLADTDREDLYVSGNACRKDLF